MTEKLSKEKIKHIDIEYLDVNHVDALISIFDDITRTKSDSYFHPHDFSLDTAKKLCYAFGEDVYLIGFVGGEPAAYGMLRGWDEGFEIPSLGIYICEKFRGCGVGRLFMDELHRLGKNPAGKIRLTVEKDNLAAIGLYQSLGYIFHEKDDCLIGIFYI